MTKNLQKIAFLTALALFVIPQVTFAAWWNPFTWSIFYNTKTPTQVLENHPGEPENKPALASTTASTSTPPAVVKPTSQQTKAVTQPKNAKPVSVKPVIVPDTAPKMITQTPTITPVVVDPELKKICTDLSNIVVDNGLYLNLQRSSLTICKNILAGKYNQDELPKRSLELRQNWKDIAEYLVRKNTPTSPNTNQNTISQPIPTPTPSLVLTPPVYTPPAPPVLPTCTITPNVSFNDNQSVTLQNSQAGTFRAAFNFGDDCWAEKVVVSDSVSSVSGYVSLNQYFPFAKTDRTTGKPCSWLSKFEGTNGNGTIASRDGAKSGCHTSSPNEWYLNVEVSKDVPVGTKVGICVLSAEDGNGQPIKGLPYCTKTWTVE